VGTSPLFSFPEWTDTDAESRGCDPDDRQDEGDETM
jgi:hypothetical protein